MSAHTETQVQQCEAQIRAQFDLLHQFLVQEEESCVRLLKQEQQEKTQMIEEELKKLEDFLDSLSLRICSVEQQQEQTTLSSSLRDHMESFLLTDESQLKSGLLIDQARVLGNLGYRVWEKMGTVVNYNPVILDPNTAHGVLCLSEDLTTVRQEETQHPPPPNPERFTKYPGVLGRELSPGWYCWDVEVGDHPHWTIGVARESAVRRQRGRPSPEDGFWCLTHRENTYTDVSGQTVALKTKPEQICVVLHFDIETATIFFYGNKDSVLICSHSGPFSERMFPFFCVGATNTNITKVIKICPIKTEARWMETEVNRVRLESKHLRALNSSLEVEHGRRRRELEQLRRQIFQENEQRSQKVSLHHCRSWKSESAIPDLLMLIPCSSLGAS